MKYGDLYNVDLVNRITGEKVGSITKTYRKTVWRDYHTNDSGFGLWNGERQILGTTQFDVSGCKTEKAAKQKIRRLVGWKYND